MTLNVLMYDWTTKAIDKLNVDDELMGPDFAPRRVRTIEKSTGQRYIVLAWRSKSFIIGAENVVMLMHKKDPSDCRVMTVADFMSSQLYFNNSCRFYGIDKPEIQYTPVVMDPYILGLWLASNQCKNKSSIFTTDPNIIQRIKTFAEHNGMMIETSGTITKPKTYNHIFKNADESTPSDIFTDMIIALNINTSKNIPMSYIKNSRDIRLELLAGLLDVSGYKVQSKPGYGITNKQHHLIMGITLLAKSLGYNALTNVMKTVSERGKKRSMVSITGSFLNEIPVMSAKKKYTEKDNNPMAFAIKRMLPIEPGPYRKISVDGDGRYLSEDFMVVMHDEHVNKLIESQAPSPKRQRVGLLDATDEPFTNPLSPRNEKSDSDDVIEDW